jgi:hypothetical protein
MNYLAVRAVSMRTLNRQRANIAFSHLLAYDKALSPKQVAAAERVFERDGVLRWTTGEVLATAKIGVSPQTLCRPALGLMSGPLAGESFGLRRVLAIYESEAHVVWPEEYDARLQLHIILKKECSPRQQLKAWLQALILAKDGIGCGAVISDAKAGVDPMEGVLSSLKDANRLFDEYSKRLQSQGWDMDSAMLETRCGSRLSVNKGS